MSRQPRPGERGPERVGEILARLFTAKGWGRKQERLQLDQAWAAAAGPKFAPETRPAGLRRGVLEIIVGNAILLQELAHYHKRRILEQLRKKLPNRTIIDLRFRAGAIEEADGFAGPKRRPSPPGGNERKNHER